MAEHNELGKQGEEIAVAYLEQQGYTILARNWVYQKAEIDIVAQKGDWVSIVEVKTRSSKDFGLPQDFVKPKKIQQIVKAADAFLSTLNEEVHSKFDIIAIYHQNGTFDIEHLENAFYHF